MTEAKRSSTLKERAPTEAVTVGLVEAVKARLARAEAILDPSDDSHRSHIGALKGFLAYLGDFGPPTTDPRSWALWLQSGYFGTREQFELGPKQAELLARLGLTRDPLPLPDETYTELIAAGVFDLGEHLQEKLSALRQENRELESRATAGDKAVVELETARRELAEERERNDGLNGEVVELRGTVAYMREMGLSEKAPARQDRGPRRTKVDGETGIYFNNYTEGRPYEVTWKDATGTLKYETLGHDLEEARRVRAEKLEEVKREREAVAA